MNDFDEGSTEAATIAALGAAAQGIQYVGASPDQERPLILVPEGSRIEDLEKYLPAPLVERGDTILTDWQSFVDFIKETKADLTTIRVFCNTAASEFVAILNPTTAGNPRWAEWRAKYSCPASREWKTWLAANKHQMKQEAFAQFIEDNALDISNAIDTTRPTAADMIEVSRDLIAKKKVGFASAIRLSNGQTQFKYEESIEGSTRNGTMNVPEMFDIAIPVFENGPVYRIEARLRYRIDQGSLVMWFDLLRPEKARDDSLAEVRKAIAEKLGVPIYSGIYGA